MADKPARPRPVLHKPKNAKAKRAVEKRLPRTVETLKKALLLHGGKTSAVVKAFLTDVGSLKKGESLKLSRSNDTVRPFETGGEASLEFLARKADTSLFLLGSHSKKRPHNLVLGRMFDFRLLDMLEFGVRACAKAAGGCSRRARRRSMLGPRRLLGRARACARAVPRHSPDAPLRRQVENYKAMREFGGGSSRAAQGSKPCLLFLGDLFESDAAMRTAKSLLTDLFRGRVVPNINLRGLDRVLIFTALPGRILLRQATTSFRKCGAAVPRVELAEMGPCADLVLRRLREPPLDLRKEAHVAAREPKRRKNVGTDSLVGTVGRVFVPRQEIGELALTKPKGVKRGRRDDAAAAKLGRRAAGAGGEPGDGGDGGDEPVQFGAFGDGLGDGDALDGDDGWEGAEAQPRRGGATRLTVAAPGPPKAKKQKRGVRAAQTGGGTQLTPGNVVAGSRKGQMLKRRAAAAAAAAGEDDF